MFTKANQHTVSTRELAWDALDASVDGQLVDGMMTAQKALELGGLLDWNVRKAELTTNGVVVGTEGRVSDDMGVKVPGQYAVLRDTDTGPVALGIVGERYQIHQNEETVELLETIVDEGGAHFEAAGYFGNGQRTFAIMKLGEGIQIGGEDSHDFRICVMNTHDGSSKLEIWTSMLRFACTNMLSPSMKGAPSRWGLRHTASLKGRVAEARRSLQVSWKWAEAFQVTVERDLLSQRFSPAAFRGMLNTLEPESTSQHEGWQARQTARRDRLTELFHSSPTCEFGRGTKWAAYNAFTEYADWYQPVKGDDPDGRKRAARQLESADGMKQAAWDYLLAA